MEITKYKNGACLGHIRHDLRMLKVGQSYNNENIDSSLTHLNYSIVNRGDAEAVNLYRKRFTSQCFKFNRKNLNYANELVIQCPSDCPPEQEKMFFETTYNWYVNNYLPAGEECVLLCEVHKDEHKYIDTPHGKKDVSKTHMHLLYVPAVKAGAKHPDYKWRLNSDQLTRRSILKEMHPSLQRELNEKGIKATVFSKKGGEKTIPLSVNQLKEITNKTGLTIDHSLTIDELADIFIKTTDLEHKVVNQAATINSLEFGEEILRSKIQGLEQELLHQKEIIKELEQTKEIEKEKTWGSDVSSWGNTKSIEHGEDITYEQ